MKANRMFWIILALLVATMSFGPAGCDCGGDDDDDSGPGGGGSMNEGDCQDACDEVFQCGGNLWYEDQNECNELCAEWLQTGVDCAECFVNCWNKGDGCISAGLCMTECAVGACIDWLEDYE